MVMIGDLCDVRCRLLSADQLDAIRPLARRYGFKHTNAGVVRFAVTVAAKIAQADLMLRICDLLARLPLPSIAATAMALPPVDEKPFEFP